ncbi:G-type lectin S-receptor-like serine/threonine-protein kinase [Nymphaea thermarum]|nr:G-type lectin S-receptor-like serine/threonine-protein kinase [Nymphaea thermarum]
MYVNEMYEIDAHVLADPGQQVEQMASLTSYWGGFGSIVVSLYNLGYDIVGLGVISSSVISSNCIDVTPFNDSLGDDNVAPDHTGLLQMNMIPFIVYILLPMTLLSSLEMVQGLAASANEVSDDRVVWVANRDKPLQDSTTEFKILENGKLVLSDPIKILGFVYQPDFSSGSSSRSMIVLDSVNLVFDAWDSYESIVWDSFGQPTTTFLPGRRLELNVDPEEHGAHLVEEQGRPLTSACLSKAGYIRHFHACSADVFEFCDEFSSNSVFLKEFNQATCVLVPKRSNPTDVAHFRPISILGTPYKIIAKLLSLQLVSVLSSIINPFQVAFVKGQCLQDVVVLANEKFQLH